MKRKLLKIIALLAVGLLCMNCCIAETGMRADMLAVYRETGDYLETLGTSQVGSIGGEWMVIGLARSGRKVPEGYYENAVAYVQKNTDENGRLHRAKSTENSRLILALTAIGADAANVAEVDLIKGLQDMNYLSIQGTNGPIWALIALDCGAYPLSGSEDFSREILVQTILDMQLNDGGWSLSGDSANADLTAMALQALAPYYAQKGAEQRFAVNVNPSVEEALICLSQMQLDDGSFGVSDGNGGIEPTSESISQVIVALCALGIDPALDERFIKNGNSALDALLMFAVDGGGFRHLADGDLDPMATEQAYYALTAYDRLLSGKTRLYDMTDVTNAD